MVRRLTAASLAAALVLLSPGPNAWAALAAPRLAAPAAPSVRLALPLLSAPAVSPVPTILTAIPAPRVVLAPVPAAPVPPAASDAPTAKSSIESLAETLAAASDAPEARIAEQRGALDAQFDLSASRPSGDASFAGFWAAPYETLSAPADAPAAPKPSIPEAPKPATPVKVVDSRASYAWHRTVLALVASVTGAVHSMPAAGAALTERALKAAADKRVVISDFDDTLAAYNQVLSPEMIEAVRAIKAAGKHFVVISDRGDEKRSHQLTVFESLEPLGDLREGMYIAANSGGRVYRFTNGTWNKVYETPALADDRKALVVEAAAATKERMKALGAEQHDPVATGNPNPAESWNTYGYAMMLKIGSSEAQVRGAAAIMQEELAARGIEAEVSPRFAKDPANPPYINFSIVTKQPATAYIAKALGASADEVVLVGDSMYTPREAKKAGTWLDRLGAKLAGRAMPKTGNATDRNMEKALPGALTIAVGHNADPRMSNAWVTETKGPATTLRLLQSVASKKAGAPKSESAVLPLVAFLALLAASGTAFYFMVSAIADILVEGERMLRATPFDPLGGFLLGSAFFLGSLKPASKPEDEDPAKKLNEDKPMKRGEKIAAWILLPLALAGSLYLWYMLYAGFATLPTNPPVDIPPGWQGPIPSGDWSDLFRGTAFLGMAAVLGFSRTEAQKAESKAKWARRWEAFKSSPAAAFLSWLGLASLTAAIYGGLAWAFTHAPAATPDVPVAPAGWEGLFQNLTVGGTLLLGSLGLHGLPAVLANPGESYPAAYERAVKIAGERGVAADQLVFVQAASVMPVNAGKQWNYEFAVPGKKGGWDLIYVDSERPLLGTALELRASTFEKAPLPDGAVPKSLTPYYFTSRGVLVSPETALGFVRKDAPAFGTRVSVSLRLEQTDDLDPWYRFYDEKGGEAAVNARTGEVKVAKLPEAAPPRFWSAGPRWVIGIAAAVGAAVLFFLR